jgi:hypothetical protein
MNRFIDMRLTPRVATKRGSSRRASRLANVSVELVWTDRPAARSARMPATVSSKAPAAPQRSSCSPDDGDSRLTWAVVMPEANRLAARPGVARRPFVTRLVRRPRDLA